MENDCYENSRERTGRDNVPEASRTPRAVAAAGVNNAFLKLPIALTVWDR